MHKKDFHRRDILKLAAYAGMLGASSMMLPHRLLAATGVAGVPINWDQTLVMIKFDGGNDGLNTVIPYTDPVYYASRPNIAVPKASQLPISNTLALNAALAPLCDGTGTAWADKDMLIALGVGYPDMSGMDSHFLSSDIWGTAIPTISPPTEGWITRYLEEIGSNNRPVSAPADAAMIGGGGAEAVGGTTIRTVYNPGTPPTVRVENNVAARASVNPTYSWMVQEQGLIDSMAANIPNVSTVKLKNVFPATTIGNNLASAARLIIGGARIPILSIYHGPFDTHAYQNATQTSLLSQFADALAVFRKEMMEQGQWDKVLVMTHAEFGRSLYENSSLGTDHGKANAHFLFGGKVKGGNFIGNQIPLSYVSKDPNGIRAPEYQIDFRQIYATIMQDWWKGPRAASDAVLQASFNPLPFLEV